MLKGLRYRVLFLGLTGLFMAPGVQAQMYVRGKKHIAIETSAGAVYSNADRHAWGGQQPGSYFGLGIKRFFFGFLNTGIKATYETNIFGHIDTSGNLNTGKHQNLRLAAETTPYIRISNVYMGKSKRYECMGITFYLTPTAGYSYNAGTTDVGYRTGSFYWGSGLGMLFKKSGSTKSQAAYDFYVNLGFRRCIPEAFYTREQKFYNTYWGVDLVLVKHRVGNFLGN